MKIRRFNHRPTVENRSLDLEPAKVDRLLAKYPERFHEDIRFALTHYRWIPFAEFEATLLQLVRYIDLPAEYELLVDPSKFGSEMWIAAELDLFRNNVKGSKDVLIIDDCAYSGNHIMFMLDEFTYDIEKHRRSRYTIHVILPYYTLDAMEQIQDAENQYGVKVKLYLGQRVETLKEISLRHHYPMTGNLVNWLSNKGPSPYDPERDHEWNYAVTTVYFDHKIANTFGSLPDLYLPLMFNKPDRSPVERWEKELSKSKKAKSPRRSPR